jgi:DNA invertase Pin-like site-specific DNA recombinase
MYKLTEVHERARKSVKEHEMAQDDTKGRAFGYVRVSKPEQTRDGRTSLDEQRRRIRGMAHMLGIDDVVIFSDEGVSGGTTLRSRPEGESMLAGLRRGDTVIASKTDRVFRSLADAAFQVEAFSGAGVDLILLDLGSEPINSRGGSAGRLYFHVMAAFAEFERARIRERSMEGKAAIRAKGYHPNGVAPFGFRIEKDDQFRRLVKDEREQEIIRAARLGWDQGKRPKDILAGLAGAGYRNRKGGPITSSQFYRWVLYSDPDRANISERTKAALARRKAAGQRMGNPEIRKVGPLGVAALVCKAAERAAEVLPHIEKLMCEGITGYREIARVLNASNIPSARGGRWHGTSVRNVLLVAGKTVRQIRAAAIPVKKLNRVRPATQQERRAIREQHPHLMTVLGPRLGSVQKQAPQILAYHAEGLTAAAIARVMGVTEQAVATVLRVAGLARLRQTPSRRRLEELRGKILGLRAEGKNGEEIAGVLGIPVHQVYQTITRIRAVDTRFGLGKPTMTPDEFNRAVALRRQKMPLAAIARQLTRSERTIYRAMGKARKMGLLDHE